MTCLPQTASHLPRRASTTYRLHFCRSAIPGRRLHNRQIRGHFAYRWHARLVETGGSGFPRQADVPDAAGTGAGRRKNVESCFLDAAAFPVRCAQLCRSAQIADWLKLPTACCGSMIPAWLSSARANLQDSWRRTLLGRVGHAYEFINHSPTRSASCGLHDSSTRNCMVDRICTGALY
jgi:hypothetical protein